VVCDQAAPDINREIAPAKIKPAAMRILLFPWDDTRTRRSLFGLAKRFLPPPHHSLVVPVPPLQRLAR
jgi:hypothetical protein